MTRIQHLRMAARLLRPLEYSLISPGEQIARPSTLIFRAQRRNASTSDKSKPIVLEQPDKFRPPSHASKMVKGRGRSSTFSGAYNQGSTAGEQEAQKKRSYPHMFPEEGTFMHSFLKSRLWHLLLTMAVLGILAITSATQTFIKTSPFGPLLPPLSSFIWHPIKSFKDGFWVIGLHEEWNSEKNEYQRARNILDAQKRRIYRRAHGMEDLDRDEDQGVDVRGIVSWDDGLTKRERAEGGIGVNRIKMMSAVNMGAADRFKYEAIAEQVNAAQDEHALWKEMFIRRRAAELGLSRDYEEQAVAALDSSHWLEKKLGPVLPVGIERQLRKLHLLQQSTVQDAQSPQEKEGSEQSQQQPTVQDDQSPQYDPESQQQPRKRKLWLGIW